MDKREHLSRLAKTLAENDTTMSGNELTTHLNRNGIKTNRGSDYVGHIGVFKFISTTYAWLVSNGRQNDADNVVKAFTKEDGSYAYEDR